MRRDRSLTRRWVGACAITAAVGLGLGLAARSLGLGSTPSLTRLDAADVLSVHNQWRAGLALRPCAGPRNSKPRLPNGRFGWRPPTARWPTAAGRIGPSPSARISSGHRRCASTDRPSRPTRRRQRRSSTSGALKHGTTTTPRTAARRQTLRPLHADCLGGDEGRGLRARRVRRRRPDLGLPLPACRQRGRAAAVLAPPRERARNTEQGTRNKGQGRLKHCSRRARPITPAGPTRALRACRGRQTANVTVIPATWPARRRRSP